MSHFESIVSNSTSIDDVEHHLTNSESGSYSGTFSSSADDDYSAPFSGQTFPTLESLIAFYQEHAKLNGFSIVKQSYRRNMSGGEHRQIGCSRVGKGMAEKQSKKVSCLARITASRKPDSEIWTVLNVHKVHTHTMDPDHSKFMPGHRHMSSTYKRVAATNDSSGVRTCKTIRMLEVQAGGPHDLQCTPKDIRNYVDISRRENVYLGDAATVKRMFDELKQKDENWFATYVVDLENRLVSMIWVDPRARAAYREFHDVVTFDTTFLLNKYNMPVATFVGVNHHGQSILLGCALISNETAQSFRWVFRKWLKAMNNVHPKAILTDQEEAIKIAIEDEIPFSAHRFCSWHVLRKIPTKFAAMKGLKEFTSEFKVAIYDNITIEDFELNWSSFVSKHSLEKHAWLISLYSIRESWVPVFLKHIFFTGMSSTQRSESMHSFFDGFIHRLSTLHQFVQKYEMAVVDRTHKELAEDYRSHNIIRKLKTNHWFEGKFRDVFTYNIFQLVQKEIELSGQTFILHENVEAEVIDGVENFKVCTRSVVAGMYSKKYIHIVSYEKDGHLLDCSCMKFQSHGLLCCHIYHVMFVQNITVLNEKYLTHRWRKDVVFPHTKILCMGAYPKMPEHVIQFKSLENTFVEVADLAIFHVDRMDLVQKKLVELKQLLLNGIKEVGPSQYGTCQTIRDLETDGMNISDQGAPLLDPHKIKRKKGRGKGNSKQTTTFRSDRAPNRPWKKKKVVNELRNTDSNVPNSQGTFI